MCVCVCVTIWIFLNRFFANFFVENSTMSKKIKDHSRINVDQTLNLTPFFSTFSISNHQHFNHFRGRDSSLFLQDFIKREMVTFALLRRHREWNPHARYLIIQLGTQRYRNWLFGMRARTEIWSSGPQSCVYVCVSIQHVYIGKLAHVRNYITCDYYFGNCETPSSRLIVLARHNRTLGWWCLYICAQHVYRVARGYRA